MFAKNTIAQSRGNGGQMADDDVVSSVLRIRANGTFL